MNIKEIAKLSGYSVATVSRVLNNDEKVRTSTRDKINRVIKENNYIPNVAAKTLRTDKSETILVVIKSIRNTVLLDVVDGVCEELRKNLYKVNLHIPEKNTDYNYYKLLLKSKTIDGIIFIASSISKEDYIELSNENVLMCSEYFGDLEMEKISIDHAKAAKDITNIVLDEGYKNIKYIRGGRTSNSMTMREKGIREAIKKRGLTSSSLVEISDKKGTEFEKYIKDFVKNNRDIDCIMLHTGDRVLEAKKALVSIGKDIKLVSFDDTYAMSFLDPIVLRVSSDNIKIGKIASKLMLKKIKGEPYKKVHKLDYKIIGRLI